jgi:small subunit ribosomal protein S11
MAKQKTPAKAAKKKSFKKKEKKVIPMGLVYIQATFNNTIVTITDQEGNTVSWSSAGSLGFRGSRKGTPFAAQQASMTAAGKAKEVGWTFGSVARGPAVSRRSARCRAPGWKSRGSAMRRRSLTTAVVRPRSGASKAGSAGRRPVPGS